MDKDTAQAIADINNTLRNLCTNLGYDIDGTRKNINELNISVINNQEQVSTLDSTLTTLIEDILPSITE